MEDSGQMGTGIACKRRGVARPQLPTAAAICRCVLVAWLHFSTGSHSPNRRKDRIVSSGSHKILARSITQSYTVSRRDLNFKTPALSRARTPTGIWADFLTNLERLEEEIQRGRLEVLLSRSCGFRISVVGVGLFHKRNGWSR